MASSQTVSYTHLTRSAVGLLGGLQLDGRHVDVPRRLDGIGDGVGHVPTGQLADPGLLEAGPLLGVVDGGVVELGGHPSRTDLGDPHAGAHQVEPQVGRHHVDGPLRRAVDGGGQGVQAGRGAEQDQVAAAPFDHPGQHGMAGVEHGRDVGVDGLVEVGRVGLDERGDAPAHSSVVDQHVDFEAAEQGP